MPIDETLDALNDLVRAGKIIISSSGPSWKMAQALSMSERRGWARFISMQNHYNLLYREEEREMIPLCVNEGVGLVPWSPLGRGLLTRPRPADSSVRTDQTARSASDTYSPRLYDDPGDWDVVDAVETVARERGVAMAEVALAWLLSRPGVVAPIVGATAGAPRLSRSRARASSLTRRNCRPRIADKPHAVRGHT